VEGGGEAVGQTCFVFHPTLARLPCPTPSNLDLRNNSLSGNAPRVLLSLPTLAYVCVCRAPAGLDVCILFLGPHAVPCGRECSTPASCTFVALATRFPFSAGVWI
jgi:hypothetical protein